jgi:hypothetical protein
MNTSSSVKFAIGVTSAIAIFAGCANGGGSQLAPSSALQQDATVASKVLVNERSTLVARAGAGVASDHGTSWMSPGAKNADLLYISDVGTNDVYVYSYPGGKLMGTLKGFGEPQGECADKKGDVWIANTATSQLFEYAHGGTSRIATLNDQGQYPVGCAIDDAGDLAATNITSTTGGRGSIAWYAHGTGSPTFIKSSSFKEIYFDGFDTAGNLFVDGWPSNFAQAQVGAIRKGSHSITSITITGATIRYPGGVQAYNGVLNVGDQVDNAIFQMTERGAVTGYTPLDGAADCVQGTVDGKTFVCPDSVNAAVEFFHYPAGGSPTRVISGPTEPTGSAISRGR